ncbi:ABC transporter, phosphonate, periplasmic substrate-binding protein [Synechococcus sp. MIT S9504]|nr:ABC transporter, phosphonate, periplasmic substrate-binding protein [Synechococcus sp. MIT S9504]
MLNMEENLLKIVVKKTIILSLIFLAGGCGQRITTQQETEFDLKKNQGTVIGNCAGSNSAKAKLRTLSIVPQFSASRIHSDYWPLLTEIGKRANICFKLDQQQSIPSFERALKEGSIDYAFMNPYHQVMVNTKYQPIIRDKKRLLTGIIVTNRQSDISSIKQLNGKTLLLPAPNAFAASLLTRAYLDKKNISFKPKYVKTHQNVYRGVARNSDFMGGGVNNTFNRENNELRSNLDILFETQGYPAHPFSARRELPLKEIQNVQTIWLEIAKEPELSSLFDKVQIKIPIEANYAKDYARLQHLGLEKFVQ